MKELLLILLYPLTYSSFALFAVILEESLLLLAVSHIFTSVFLYRIGEKARVANPLVAWIPIANLGLLTEITGKPSIWLLALLIPGVNLFVYAVLWMEIVSRLRLNYLLGMLIPIPFIGPFVMAWVSMAGEQESNPYIPLIPAY